MRTNQTRLEMKEMHEQTLMALAKDHGISMFSVCDCNCDCKEVVLFCAFTMGIIVVQVSPMIVASNVIVTLSVLVFIKLPDK
jgi:hypothetical protein